jgi:hypothetical protein
MKKKETNPLEYLERVLKEWDMFCKSHRLIAESIQAILNENKLLKAELDCYKKRDEKQREYSRNYYNNHKQKQSDYYKKRYLNKCKQQFKRDGDSNEGNQS